MVIDIEKIERIDLNAGEVLHVKSVGLLSCQQREYIYDLFKAVLPDNEVLISDRHIDITLEAINPEA